MSSPAIGVISIGLPESGSFEISAQAFRVTRTASASRRQATSPDFLATERNKAETTE